MTEKLMYRDSMAGTHDVKLEGGHCVANIGVGKDWLTVYLIETEVEHRGKGEATRLLKALQELAKRNKSVIRLWCPMNDKIKAICKKLDIEIV